VNSFGDEPLANREEVFKNDLVTQSPHKMTHISWPGQENLSSFLEYDELGNLHLRAVDFETSQAEIVLSSNGFQFTVSFPFRLPNKKAQWQ
jgi:hypothetical protein